MSRMLLTLFFILTTLAGMIIMLMSMGWMFLIFGIVLFPTIILHFIAGIKTLRRFPYLGPGLLVGSISFLGFSLCRPDMDDVGQYTGLSSLLNAMDPQHGKYVQSLYYSFFGAILFLIFTITLDIILWRKSKRPPPVSVNNELV